MPQPTAPVEPGQTPQAAEPPQQQQSVRTHRRRWWPLLLLVLMVAVGAFMLLRPKTGNTSGAAPTGRGPGRGAIATPVEVTRATTGNIGVYVTGLGAVTPINTVTIRTRVDGQLMSVHFREGDLVHRGDLLVEIDPRPFQAAVEQAQGQLTRDQAALDNARLDLARYETLIRQDAIAQQQLTTQQSLVVQDEGNVTQDRGTLASAQVNLTYTRIVAPITGRVGLRLVDAGNIVHASDANGLLVITQVQPISVIFTISEDQLGAVRRRLRGGAKLPVDVFDREMKNKLASGALATIDNEIDQTTGTIRIRANFDNANDGLFPNEFVNARLLLQEKRGVTLIPTAAVQRSAQTFVFLVRPNNTVITRPVTLGTSEGGQAEITSGLAPGDMVVMTGVDKLQDGSKVIPHLAGGQQPRPGA